MLFYPPPAACFAVATDPGTRFERVDSYDQTLQTAQVEAHELRDGLDSVDVMAVRSASLTGPAQLTTQL